MKYNGVLLAGVLGWAIAQILKFIFYLIVNKVAKAERLFGSGGMPSSHSAMVCAALAATGRAAGVESPTFAVMFILAAIVMYDAMNVRQAAGQHAKILNDLKRRMTEAGSLADRGKAATKDLKEYLGHTPLEVVCGAILGIGIGFLLPL